MDLYSLLACANLPSHPSFRLKPSAEIVPFPLANHYNNPNINISNYDNNNNLSNIIPFAVNTRFRTNNSSIPSANEASSLLYHQKSRAIPHARAIDNM
jgi:hypothetical protein